MRSLKGVDTSPANASTDICLGTFNGNGNGSDTNVLFWRLRIPIGQFIKLFHLNFFKILFRNIINIKLKKIKAFHTSSVDLVSTSKVNFFKYFFDFNISSQPAPFQPQERVEFHSFFSRYFPVAAYNTPLLNAFLCQSTVTDGNWALLSVTHFTLLKHELPRAFLGNCLGYWDIVCQEKVKGICHIAIPH